MKRNGISMYRLNRHQLARMLGLTDAELDAKLASGELPPALPREIGRPEQWDEAQVMRHWRALA